MATSEEIYSPAFSLERLSELTGIRKRLLSTVLNEGFGMNFYALLNRYRIRKAIERLTVERTFSRHTLESVGMSVGYRSRTTFINAFRHETGMTPSQYISTVILRAGK